MCVSCVCEAAGGREVGGRTDTEPKTRTPHKDVGNNPCHQVPRLPHKVKVDVTKCHACHAKRRGVTAPPGNQARHQSQPSAISATPATQSEGGCHQVPRLPRKTPLRHSAAWEPSATPEPTQCHKRHACHAK